MWIVKLALRRPYSFAVMALLMLVLGVVAIFTMRKDIFPYIDIPVVSVVWSYAGMSPQEMAERIVTVDERAMTTTVNDIEHMESTSYPGTAVVRVFFHPQVKVELAIAQITALSQTILKPMPAGTTAPGIISYDASSVPILQIGLHSDTLSEQQLFDAGQNFIRTRLATVEGASVPLPYGGKSPAIMVDLDPDALYAKHLSATDVSDALAAQNLILPAGTAKVGGREYFVKLNSSPATVEGLNELPIRNVGGAAILLKDVAQVRQGSSVQTNIVRQDGRRGALLEVLKHGQASTLEIVDGVKGVIEELRGTLPAGMQVQELFDQSIFVRAAIGSVLREAAIAAALTGLMILLFLGSWRSTLIVCISIPLSILTSLAVLALLRQTINVMTLGGLALAVGILVDDATVEVENIHRNLAMHKPLTRAILDGAQQIAVPAFVSTLSICVVFVPVLLLTGAAKFLFTPLAGAVVFAMLTSYLLSRTLIPSMVHFLLPKEAGFHAKDASDHASGGGHGRMRRIGDWVDRRFTKVRHAYKDSLEWSLGNRAWIAGIFAAFFALSALLLFFVGRDFFPYVDSGQMRLHVRAPAGTRLEETERIFAAVEREIRKQVPPGELQAILDNIGLPPGGINLAFGDTATTGPHDGEILIALNKKHSPTPEHERRLRDALAKAFPEEIFFFGAANITNQILNFGVQSPIDVQVTGRDEHNYAIATQLSEEIAKIPGVVDVHLGQQRSSPTVGVEVDRLKAGEAGLTQRDVANSVLISLSGTGQVAPTQWLNPQNGVSYQVSVQTPQYRIDSFDALKRTPITSASGAAPAQLLGNLATFKRETSTGIVSHYDVQPVFDVYANVDRSDMGNVAAAIDQVINKYEPKMAQGNRIRMRGQVATMRESFTRLEIGIVFALLFVYLIMAVNFQSWIDPLIILMAIPGTFAGILWMLFITQTTFSVPSLMGAIMAIGVATANSILMVVFANDERAEGKDAHAAAVSAGYTRMRPVIMTALAMVIGMLPMALALGEGGEQNAPLGRAVIGGLLMATLTTLYFVPIAYSWLRKKAPEDRDRRIDEEYHAGERDAAGHADSRGGPEQPSPA